MEKYEYKTENIGLSIKNMANKISDAANKNANEGWELVSTFALTGALGASGFYMTYKRKIK